MNCLEYQNYSFFNQGNDYCYKDQKDRKDQYDRKDKCDHKEQKDKKDHCYEEQRHVHELLGSVQIAGGVEPHNHRFATVTGEAIPCGPNDHVHEVCFRTDFYEDHFHEFKGRTCGAIQVGDRHVHFIESVTSVNDGHKHKFRAATLIEDPIGEEDKCKKQYPKDDYPYRKDYEK